MTTCDVCQAGSGQQLYDRWCASMANGWRSSRGLFTTMADVGQPSSPPVQWSFLTPLERDAWDGLAAEVDTAIACHVSAATAAASL